MAEATIGTTTTAGHRSGRPALSVRHPAVRLVIRAYLSTAIAVAVFGVGYGLSLLDARSCTIQGWSCAMPRALLLAAFLAFALVALLFAAHRTGLGLSWFMITAGLAGLVLVAPVPLPLVIGLLVLVPGLTAGMVRLVRSGRLSS